MKKLESIFSLSVALSLSCAWFSAPASAGTKLNATPLPHEKDFANGGETVIPPDATSFPRRHAMREKKEKAEKDAADAAKKVEDDKKAAADAQTKADLARSDAFKKQQQLAVDANNNGVNLGKANRWDEALAEHEKAVTYDPTNKQFRINLSAARTAYGQQKLAKGDLPGAAHLFRMALAAAPDNSLASKSLAAALKKGGMDPGNAELRLSLGDKFAQTGDTTSAAIEYNAAMQIDPNAKVITKLGDIALSFGQTPQAIQYYQKALAADPDFGPAYRQIGYLQVAAGDMTSGAASLRKAVVLDPKDSAASTALVSIWRKQVAANPNSAENHLGLAGALQISNDFNGADAEYKKAESIDPRNPGIEAGRGSLQRAYQHQNAERHQAAATTLFNQGLKKEALAEIGQAVNMEPRNANYQFMLGQCLEQTGDIQGAHQAYLNCVLIDPENNKEAASRMKAMDERGGASNARPMGQQPSPPQQQQQAPYQVAPQNQPQPGMMSGAPQSMDNSAYSQSKPGFTPMLNTPVSTAPQQQGAFPRKNMYEGGSGASDNTAGMNFRTHDESAGSPGPNPGQPPNPANDAAFSQQKPVAGASDALNQVAAAEAQRDYNGAVGILKQMLNDNLQNPDIHHRLAVNLMSAGNITEALSEFRIASALSPSRKDYSADLARAMAIHKRSLESSAGSSH